MHGSSPVCRQGAGQVVGVLCGQLHDVVPGQLACNGAAVVGQVSDCSAPALAPPGTRTRTTATTAGMFTCRHQAGMDRFKTMR